MQTMTNRQEPLTEAEAKTAEPVGFSASPDTGDEKGRVEVVVAVPGRAERICIEQYPMPDVFETAALWLVPDGLEEVEFVDEEAEDALARLALRAGAAHVAIAYSDATHSAVLETLRQDDALAVDLEAPAAQHEHMVPVIFDVVASDRRRAAEVVAEALALTDGAGLRLAFDQVNQGKPGHLLEAWWFPEADDKQVDRNDRPEMWMLQGSEAEVRAEECEEVRRLLQTRTGWVAHALVEDLSDALESRADRLRCSVGHPGV